MVDYREILRLKDLGDSQHSIALKVQSSRNTVPPGGPSEIEYAPEARWTSWWPRRGKPGYRPYPPR